MANNQKVTQAVVVASSAIGPPSQGVEYIALYNTDGSQYPPVEVEPPVIPPTVVALTDGTTVAVDASLGNYFTLTLTGNHTLGVPTNPTDGQKVTFEVTQDATGTRTLAFASSAGGFSFGAASAPTVTATAAAVSMVEFSYSARKAKWLYRNSQLGF